MRGEAPSATGKAPEPADGLFALPVRCGRRRSDPFGRLVFTAASLVFRGTHDLDVPWTDVGGVDRDGRELVVSLAGRRRVLRFACESIGEAARGGVIAAHLRQRAHATGDDEPGGTAEPRSSCPS